MKKSRKLKWKPNPKGIKAAMKAWCNFAGTSDEEVCMQCLELDFLTMLEAYMRVSNENN